MKKCKSPFIYGGKITGDAFCDRTQETDELIEDIRSRQHVIIYSQRRFGKTSLVLKVLEEARGARDHPRLCGSLPSLYRL